MYNETKIIHALILGDREGEIARTWHQAEAVNVVEYLEVVANGEEALQYLYKQGKFTDVTTPDIIILDDDMPQKNGAEVLKKIKSDASLSHIPVVLLAASEDVDDVVACYRHHANCYITKPAERAGLKEIIEKLKFFWLDIAQLPRR